MSVKSYRMSDETRAKFMLRLSRKIYTDERLMLGHSPFEPFNSSPRELMKYVQLGQSLEILYPDSKLLYTGIDMQYGEYTFKQKAPCQMKVLGIYPLYNQNRSGIKHSPITMVYYQDMDRSTPNQVVDGVLELRTLNLMSKSFGFVYRQTKDCTEKLMMNEIIEEGTELMVSNTVRGPMDYRHGIQGNTIALSDPAVLQDGIIISRSFSERASFYEFGKRTGSCGKRMIPLNLYGDPDDPDDYKIFPDIGEFARKDNLLMAFREFNELTAPVDMTDKALRTLMPTDVCVYGSKDSPTEVIDVRVHYNDTNGRTVLDPSMRVQTDRYVSESRASYERLYQAFCARRRNEGAVLDEVGSEVMTWAHGNRMSVQELSRKRQPNISKTLKGEPLDEIRIELTFRAKTRLSEGKKMSNFCGGKGVVVKIRDDIFMPLDAFGNRSEVQISGNTYVKRLIGAAPLEVDITSIDQQMLRYIKKMLSEGKTKEEVVQYYLEYVDIISPKYKDEIIEASKDPDAPMDIYHDHIEPYLKADAPNKFVHRLRIPITNPRNMKAALPLLADKADYRIGPVTLFNEFGDEVQSKYPMPIGSVYYCILEKTGDEWTVTDTAKRTPLNTPARQPGKDKFASPIRNSAARIFSETEKRWWDAILGPEFTRDWKNISDSPESTRSWWDEFLTTAGDGLPLKRLKPNKRGMSRPMKIIHQVYECQGIGFGRNGVEV